MVIKTYCARLLVLKPYKSGRPGRVRGKFRPQFGVFSIQDNLGTFSEPSKCVKEGEVLVAVSTSAPLLRACNVSSSTTRHFTNSL